MLAAKLHRDTGADKGPPPRPTTSQPSAFGQWHNPHEKLCGDGTQNEHPLDELQELATWLEANAFDSTDTVALRIPIRQLSLSIVHLEDGDELLPALMQHGPSLLRNLFILGTPSELALHLRRDGEPLPGLLPMWLDALTLPRSGTLKTLDLRLGIFDASAVQALVSAVPHLRLEELSLRQDGVAAPDPTIASNIVRAVLQCKIARLAMHRFDLTTIDSGCWDLLSANRTLQELRLEGDLGVPAFEGLASALTSNTCLRELELCDRTSQGRCHVFAGALADNSSLEWLTFRELHIRESDMLDFSQGLRKNRTSTHLALLCEDLTPRKLQPLIETVRYHNDTLEHVGLPSDPVQEQRLLDAVCRFHFDFRVTCRTLQNGPTEQSEAVLRRWWPLLGSNYPTAKATVLFCVARVRAEVAARSFKAGDGVGVELLCPSSAFTEMSVPTLILEIVEP